MGAAEDLLNKMRPADFACRIVVLLGLLIIGKAEIYIVTIEGEPVISYKGGIDGFEATAVDSDSDEKIDVTRLLSIVFPSPQILSCNRLF